MTTNVAFLFARKGEAEPVERPALELSDPARFATLRLPVRPPAAPRSRPLAVTRPPRIGVTLRLDPPRHDRLRHAAAAGGRSMQSILLQAFDALFAAVAGGGAGDRPDDGAPASP